ncbi:MAG: ATP-grasp domain-containing protein [Lachnospiraceae bacterium]|nr:ATP-grasp domain-containing protein [Lachnospiraceae bacterium]
MKKIVIIGASEFQNPLILKAKEFGYETHVFAWKDGSVGEKTADYFYDISIVNKEEIYEKCVGIQPDAVATIASDLANITVQYLCKKLGLICNSDKCIENSTNKYKMRRALEENGVKVPKYTTIVDIQDKHKIQKFEFPIIIKPTDRSGSRGITKVNNGEELDYGVEKALKYSFEKAAIVEEYITGDEYSCETISWKGEHHILAITKKFTTGSPKFIETAHIEPANLEKCDIDKVKEEVIKALDALDIKYGAAHTEFKISENGEVRIIEIGSRMGGDCIGSHLVGITTGFDYLKMVIDVAMGIEPQFDVGCAKRFAAVKFVFEKKDIETLEKIRKECSEDIIYISEIERFDNREIVDSGSRYGFYIVKGNGYNELLQKLEIFE